MPVHQIIFEPQKAKYIINMLISEMHNSWGVDLETILVISQGI